MAFSTLEALQAFGLGQQQAMQKREYERRERELDRKEQTRLQVSESVGSGDYRGGVQAAIGGGEYDLAASLSKLDANQREEALQQAQIMGRVAQQLKGIPAERRASAYQQFLPTLQSAGLDPDQLAQADLSDAGLDGYAQMGQSIASVLNPPKPVEPTTFQRDAMSAGIQPGTAEYQQVFRNRYAPPGFFYGNEGGVAGDAPDTLPPDFFDEDGGPTLPASGGF